VNYLFERCKSHPWNSEFFDNEHIQSVKSMLSINERKMLYWLAREFPVNEDEAVVDLGCFLGGSTVALCHGMHENQHVINKQYAIHSYDIFLAPSDGYYLGYIGGGLKPGMSTIGLYLDNLGKYSRTTFIHAGDFAVASPPPGTIGILFVDIAKNWELNDVVISRFFSRLVPGHSIVIQQDHNDHSCPWINLAMAYFSEYFEILCDDHSSRVYGYTKTIPAARLACPLKKQLSGDEMLELMGKAIKSSSGVHSRFFNHVTTAWLILEYKGFEAAMRHLDQSREQAGYPWDGAGEYISMVRELMTNVVQGSKPSDGMDFL